MHNRTLGIVMVSQQWILYGVVVLCLTSSFASAQERLVPVDVQRVVRDEVASASRFVVTVVPTRRSVVGAAVDGRVEQFLNDPEDAERKIVRVTKNQVIAQLKIDTVSRELDAAKAELQLREAELQELRNGSRPEEITTAKAQVDRWNVRRQYMESRLSRLQTLFDNNKAVSLDQFEEARSEAEQAEHSYQEALAQYDLIVAGPRAEVVAQAEARRDAQKFTVERLEQVVMKYSVRAPFDGFVVNEFTEVGAWVKSGDPVAEVIQLSPLEVEASLPEKHIPDIHLGTAAVVHLDAMPGREYAGVVHRVIPQADVRSRTFPLRVRLDESLDPVQEHIMAGMLGHVQIEFGDAAAMLLLPKDALVLGGPTPKVVVIDSKEGEATGVARSVPVTLGVERGGMIQVRGEIKVHELVVVRGNERLRDGQQVSWRERAAAGR